MNIFILQLCIVKEPGIVGQFKALQQIADNEFVTACDPDIICTDQCLTGQECFVKMILIIDDKRFPAFHIQCAVIDTVCFIPVDLCCIRRIIASHAQVAVQYLHEGLRHMIRRCRNACIRAGQNDQLIILRQLISMSSDKPFSQCSTECRSNSSVPEFEAAVSSSIEREVSSVYNVM